MVDPLLAPQRLAVIGLGYVGLPLAVAFAAHHQVTGFDIDTARIAELQGGRDRTGEVDPPELAAAVIDYTADPAALAGQDLYIVTVPTPVTADHQPDLRPLERACQIIAPHLRPGAVVVFESTVYPGVTEEICGALLAAGSGLACGIDFHLGYSPERINPGDRTHRLQTIVKVVSGQSAAVTDRLVALYAQIVPAGIFRAASIKTAEAAKVIENAQRDINIAFINEVTLIFRRLGLSIWDVLAAARTKWNFLPFQPGLVGGHCIGVDPYYLADLASRLGHDPAVILAGRRINDDMAQAIATAIAAELAPGSRVLIAGLTFKENVPDLRNSKVRDLARALAAAGHGVALHDPLADGAEIARIFDQAPVPDPAAAGPFDAVIFAVPHAAYADLPTEALAALVSVGGLIADIKGLWRHRSLPAGRRYWSL